MDGGWEVGGRVQLLEQTGSCRSKLRSGKRHFLSKRHFRQHLTTSHFYRGPCGLGREKWPHQCSSGSRVNRSDGKRGGSAVHQCWRRRCLHWQVRLSGTPISPWLMGNLSLNDLMRRGNQQHLDFIDQNIVTLPLRSFYCSWRVINSKSAFSVCKFSSPPIDPDPIL